MLGEFSVRKTKTAISQDRGGIYRGGCFVVLRYMDFPYPSQIAGLAARHRVFEPGDYLGRQTLYETTCLLPFGRTCRVSV